MLARSSEGGGTIPQGRCPGARKRRYDLRMSEPRRGASFPTTVLVAAAVLIEDGRVLLTQRKPGTHLAGAWEFPGGKVEAGEDPREALRRELREEVGIEAQVGE